MSTKTKRVSPERVRSRNTKLSKKRLPPDPEGCNPRRASSAKAAVKAYRAVSGADMCDVISDLIGDLIHLCDREPRLGSFEAGLRRALRFYQEETATDAEYVRM